MSFRVQHIVNLSICARTKCRATYKQFRAPQLKGENYKNLTKSGGWNVCLFDRLFAAAVNQVPNRRYGMAVYHARPGVTHDLDDPFPHNRLETMHRAPGTGGLSLLERTLLQTSAGILQKRRTILAQFIRAMILTAIYAYHRFDSIAFPFDAGMFNLHVR